MTEDDIKAIAAEYDADIAKAAEARAAKLREALEQGWMQKDLSRLTGYTRETLRRILNPEVAEQIKARRRVGGA